jgi:outer membrane protein assembly factor BamB
VAAAAALAVAACAPGPVGGPAGSGRPALSGPAVSHPASAAAAAQHFQVNADGCVPVAAGYDITGSGTAAWAVQLPGAWPAQPGFFEPAPISPVAVDGLAVYAFGNVISARRLTDGRQAWQRTVPEPAGTTTGEVGGLWAWHGELIALIAPTSLGQRPVDMRVQALSAATGAVRWTAGLGEGDLYNDQVITSAGVLAVLTELGGAGGQGKLMAVGLDAGRLLWSRPYGKDELTDGPTAAGPVIVMAEHGMVTGFDAATGAVRWSHGGMPGPVESLAGPGDEVLLYDPLQQTLPGQPAVPASRLFPVTALDAATGAVLWRAATAGPVSELSAAGGLISVGSGAPYRLTLLSPGGRVAWSVPGFVASDMTWVNDGADLVYVSTEPDVRAPGIEPDLTSVVDLSLATGTVRWSTRLGDAPGAQLAWPAGGNLVVTEEPVSADPPAALAVDPATGQVRATATLARLTVTTPLTVAGGDILLEMTSGGCAVPGTSAAPVAGGSAAASSSG